MHEKELVYPFNTSCKLWQGIPAIGLVNDVHEVAGSPLNETCEGMPYISTGIDALGVVVPLLDPRRAVLEAPGIIIDGVGSYQGVKQIIKDSN